MKFHYAIPALMLFASINFAQAQSFAPASCVQKATDDELIIELQRRLGSSGGAQPEDLVQVYATCSGSELGINSVRIDKGINHDYKLYASNSSTCREFADTINRKSPKLGRGGLVAACSGSELHVITIAQSGEMTSKKNYTSSGSDCTQQAVVINGK